MVTDDFTQGKFILEAALEQNGELNEQVLRSAFRRWMDYPFYPNFTGPTTRAAMQRIFNDTRSSLQGDAEAGEEREGAGEHRADERDDAAVAATPDIADLPARNAETLRSR